jgi:hypothetical protein
VHGRGQGIGALRRDCESRDGRRQEVFDQALKGERAEGIEDCGRMAKARMFDQALRTAEGIKDAGRAWALRCDCERDGEGRDGEQKASLENSGRD